MAVNEMQAEVSGGELHTTTSRDGFETGPYAEPLERFDLFGTGYPDVDWMGGFLVPVVRTGSASSRTYHAPAAEEDDPNSACSNVSRDGRGWIVEEWGRIRAWREPCGAARCQERFKDMGLDVHSRGRDG